MSAPCCERSARPTMMNPNSIYRKTEAGLAEIQSRALGLRAELRRLLILMDGTATLARLAVFVRGAEIGTLVAELEQRGLVTTGVSAGASGFGLLPAAELPPLTDITATQPVHAAAAGDNILEPSAAQMLAVRRTAVSTLHNLLGSDASKLIMQIERCSNANEMRAAVNEVRHVLDRQMGASVGRRFLEAVRGAAEDTR